MYLSVKHEGFHRLKATMTKDLPFVTQQSKAILKPPSGYNLSTRLINLCVLSPAASCLGMWSVYVMFSLAQPEMLQI